MSAIAARLGADGFALVRAPEMRDAIGADALADWDRFAASWNDLGQDRYMADGGRYRRRRHAAFAIDRDGAMRRKPHQPHYQSRDYNVLNGGIERWFAPVRDDIADHPAMRAILDAARLVFDSLTPPPLRPPSWHVELHQFRIEARADAAGQPTPEGMHRDGVDWALVLLVRRENVASGETGIVGHDGRTLGAFTLADPLDAALVDDDRVFHGVTAVTPVDPDRPAWRDVLVVTFRR